MLPLRQWSPGDCDCSRSDGGVAGDSVCCDVARRSPESFGGEALGDCVAASPEAALHDFASFPLYCLFSSLPFTGLGRNGGLFFYTMHLMFYTVPRLLTGLSRIGSGHSFRTTTPVKSGLFIMPSSGFVSRTGSLPSLFAAAST